MRCLYLVSCKNKSGAVKHIRNVDPKDEKRAIVISKLLATTFKVEETERLRSRDIVQYQCEWMEKY